jgi:hypothetical protein
MPRILRQQVLTHWGHPDSFFSAPGALVLRQPHWKLLGSSREPRPAEGATSPTWLPWLPTVQQKGKVETGYPLVNSHITNWKIPIFNGKIHYKSQFSIAMLYYQRVNVCIKTRHGMPWPKVLLGICSTKRLGPLTTIHPNASFFLLETMMMCLPMDNP